MGAGTAPLSTPGPLPAVTGARTPGSESGAQEAAGGAARFSDAMDSAKGVAASRADSAASQAAPTRSDTPPRGRAARAAAPARAAAQPDSAPAGATQDGAPPGAASGEPPPAAEATAQSDADTVTELLPALVAGVLTRGAGSASGADASAPQAADRAANSDPADLTAEDPVGLLAMILGVAPAPSSALAAMPAASASATASATASAGAPQGAAPGTADAGAASGLALFQPAGLGASGTEVAEQLAALPDASISSAGGGSSPAAQASAAPSAQALSELMRSLAPAAAPAAGAAQSIAVPVGSAGWPGAMAAQVHWLVGSGVSSATLHLSPEHLGPVQVTIDLQSSQVNVSFSAAHADTRAAIEQALPKLREMFATGGLTLGQASVQQEARSGSQSASGARVTRVADTAGAAAPPPAVQALGLVDEYA
jgi:flagellar hook-length control protein FliK